MKSIFEYETDSTAVNDGRWFDLKLGGQQIGRVKLKPALMGLNGRWRLAKAKMVREIAAEVVERQVENGEELPAEYQGKVLADAMWQTVVVDYELYDTDGETLLEVSRDTWVDLMQRVPIALDAILVQAENFAKFQTDREAESGKGSPTT